MADRHYIKYRAADPNRRPDRDKHTERIRQEAERSLRESLRRNGVAQGEWQELWGK